MLHFSDSEKGILRQLINDWIVDQDNYRPITLFKKEFSEGKLQWDAEVRLGNNQRKYIKSYKITFRKLAVRDPNVDESKILSNIYEKAILLNKLEQNGFLIFIEDLKDIDKQLKRLRFPDKVLPLGTRYHFDFKYGEILRKSIWHTIFISSELFNLENNNFKTTEELLLDQAFTQSSTATNALNETVRQTKVVSDLLTEAKTQTKEALKQTEEAKEQTHQALYQTEQAQLQTEEARKQSSQALMQTEEALKQTKEVLKQTIESKTQTKEALKQTKEALKQTKEANKQSAQSRLSTIFSFVAMIFSFVVLIFTIIQSNKNNAVPHLEQNNTDSTTENIDTIKSRGSNSYLQLLYDDQDKTIIPFAPETTIQLDSVINAKK